MWPAQMCHFITSVLSPSTRAEEVRKIAKDYKLRWERVHNRSIERTLAAGDAYFFTTAGTCDCGTAIGSHISRKPEPTDTNGDDAKDAKLRKKLAKRGWSEAKIARVLQQQRRQVVNRRAAYDHAQLGARGELRRWVEFIAALSEARAARAIAILLHWYDGTVESELIDIQRHETIDARQLIPEMMLEWDEDVLYWIQLKGPPKISCDWN